MDNIITRVNLIGRQKGQSQTGYVMTEVEVSMSLPLGKETDAPLESSDTASPANILILAP